MDEPNENVQIDSKRTTLVFVFDFILYSMKIKCSNGSMCNSVCQILVNRYIVFVLSLSSNIIFLLLSICPFIYGYWMYLLLLFQFIFSLHFCSLHELLLFYNLVPLFHTIYSLRLLYRSFQISVCIYTFHFYVNNSCCVSFCFSLISLPVFHCVHIYHSVLCALCAKLSECPYKISTSYWYSIRHIV